jgi:hypothetical protein
MSSQQPHQWVPWTEDLRQALVDILGDEVEQSSTTLYEELVDGKCSCELLLDILEKAIRMDKGNPDIVFAYCRALAEVLRDKEAIPQNSESISFGTKRNFGNAGHMRNYIFDQCS